MSGAGPDPLLSVEGVAGQLRSVRHSGEEGCTVCCPAGASKWTRSFNHRADGTDQRWIMHASAQSRLNRFDSNKVRVKVVTRGATIVRSDRIIPSDNNSFIWDFGRR